MKPLMAGEVADLAAQYLQFARTELKANGQPRSTATLYCYRNALECFVTAVQGAGLKLTDLPENFIESHWIPALSPNVSKWPIQVRVRATAIKNFLLWLKQQNVPYAPLHFPIFKTPRKAKVPKIPKEPVMSNAPPLHDVNQLGDPNQFGDSAVPATQSYQAPTQGYQAPTPAYQAQPAGYQAPMMQTAIPPPAPRNVPAQVKARANPLAALLPSGQYKLRVRRERDGADDVFVDDYPHERVTAAGAVEPFLMRNVVPKMLAQGVTGDVTFVICHVDPQGREGDRSRFTLACVPVQQPMPVQTIVNGVPTQNPTTQQELADTMAFYRRAQEELEERMATRMAPQQSPVVPQERSVPNTEMDDLKRLVGQLAGSVRDLSDRLESRDSRRVTEWEAPAPAAPPPQLDILKLVEAVNEMSKRNTPAPIAQPQNMGLGDLMDVMSKAKGMFQPQNIQVDTSPMEEEIKELRKDVAAQVKGKSAIKDMLTDFSDLKSLFSLVGGESAPKPTFGAALGSLFTKIIENPAPLAEAAERVLNAASALKQGTKAPEPAPQKIPPQMIEATKQLLNASDPSALVVAAHEWLSLMTRIPALQKPATRIGEMIRDGKATELSIILRQVVGHLGSPVTPDKAAQMAHDILAQVQKPNAVAEEEEAEESEGPPDLLVRVGGAAQQESEEAGEDESDEEDGSEGEGDGGEDEDDNSDDEGEDAEEGVEPTPVTVVTPVAVTSKVVRVEPPSPPLGLREMPKPSAPNGRG